MSLKDHEINKLMSISFIGACVKSGTLKLHYDQKKSPRQSS